MMHTPASRRRPGVGRGAVRPAAAFGVAWAVFWLLLVTVAVQDHLRRGATDWWKPVLWELSSCAVASALAWLMWRRLPRHDALLARPLRWAAQPLALLPVVAPLFVAVVFAIRHAVHGLVGEPYRHEPWPQVFLYEGLKFAVFYGLFVAVVFGLRSYRALEAERAAAREAQLAQLAQQLEPHFLFNALNTIASLIASEPALAERLVTRLAALLRAATDLTRAPVISLDEELRLLAAYAEIMGQRFADRVHIEWRVDEALRASRVPALVAQPLLENAFRHGVERHRGMAEIVVAVERRGDRLAIEVRCNLGVLDGEPRAGVGLANLRRRLALAYGEDARLSLSPQAGGGVVARVEWPCES